MLVMLYHVTLCVYTILIYFISFDGTSNMLIGKMMINQ